MPRRVRALALALLVAPALALAGCTTPDPDPDDGAPAASPFRDLDCAEAPPTPRAGEAPPPLACRRAASGAGVVRLDAGRARPESSGVSPASADGARLLLVDALAGEWRLVDGRSGANLGVVALPPTATEPRWSPLDRHGLYALDGNAILRYDVPTATHRVLARFENHTGVRMGGGSDLALLDSGHVKLALLAERVVDGGTDLLVLSLRERATFGRETVSSRLWPLPEDERAEGAAVTMGDLVVTFTAEGAVVRRPPDGEVVARVATGVEPMDLCRTDDRREWLLGVRPDDAGDALVAVALLGGEEREVLRLPPGERVVASCRATHAPGSVVASVFRVPGAAPAPADSARAGQVLVASLEPQAPPPRVLLRHEAATVSPARFVPLAVPDRDLARVLVATDWGDADGPVATYAAGVPDALAP